MDKEERYNAPRAGEEDKDEGHPSPGKRPWQEPKLAFVEPKLRKHGALHEVTGFFGGFTPDSSNRPRK